MVLLRQFYFINADLELGAERVQILLMKNEKNV